MTFNRLLISWLILISIIGIIYFSYTIFADKAVRNTDNPYEYDIESYKKTDSQAYHFAEAKRISVNGSHLFAIAIGGKKDIYVSADTFLIRLDENGAEKDRFKLNQSAKCLALDGENKCYLGETNVIEVLDEKGQRLNLWRDFDSNTIFTSLAIFKENIFAADAANKIVYRLDKSGKQLGRIGEKDEAKGIPGFVIPSPYFDVAVDEQGFVWVANTGRHSLENYTADGKLRSFWGKYGMDIAGFCGCCNPSHFALLSDGSFVTSEKGIARVKVYNAIGELVAVVASPDQFLAGTVGLDLAADAKDQIYVLDPKNRIIRIFVKK